MTAHGSLPVCYHLPLMPLQDNLSLSIVVAKAEDLDRAIDLTSTTTMRAKDGAIVGQLSLLVEEAQRYMEESGLDRLELQAYTSTSTKMLCGLYIRCCVVGRPLCP